MGYLALTCSSASLLFTFSTLSLLFEVGLSAFIFSFFVCYVLLYFSSCFSFPLINRFYYIFQDTGHWGAFLPVWAIHPVTTLERRHEMHLWLSSGVLWRLVFALFLVFISWKFKLCPEDLLCVVCFWLYFCVYIYIFFFCMYFSVYVFLGVILWSVFCLLCIFSVSLCVTVVLFSIVHYMFILSISLCYFNWNGLRLVKLVLRSILFAFFVSNFTNLRNIFLIFVSLKSFSCHF